MESTALESGDPSRPSLSRGLRLTIVGLVLARGVVGLCTTPLFEGWDEYQHVAYIVHIQETGSRAILNETLVPAKVIEAIHERFPQPEPARVQFPNALKPNSYDSYWRQASAASGPATNVERPAQPFVNELRLYQAQHSWWYYVLVTPVFRVLGGLDDLTQSLGGLRMLNLAFTAGAVWIALGVVANRVRDRRAAGWISLLIGVQPLFVMNGIRFSTDAPGVFFAVAAVSQMMRLAVDDQRLLGRSMGVGLLIGAAILMKATNFALLPALGVCWLLAVARVRPSAGTAIGSAAMIGLAVAVLIGPDVAHNLAQYGVATPMQEAIENRAKGRGAAELYRAFREFPVLTYGRWLFEQGLFIQGNWSFVTPVQEFLTLHGRLIDLALLGFVLAVTVHVARRALARLGTIPSQDVRPLIPAIDSAATLAVCASVCAGFYAALLYHALQSALAWGTTTTGPWYASPALPWFLILVGVGACGWPRFLSPALVGGLVFLSIAAEHTSWWVRMLPIYSGGAEGLEALRRITSRQPWYLSTTTCVAALGVGGSLFAVAVRLIAISERFAPADGSSSSRRPAWLRLRMGERRERVDAATLAIPTSVIMTATSRTISEEVREQDSRV